jgi:release factor glutamine methyltransferase
MILSGLNQELIESLLQLYSAEESKVVSRIILERITGLDPAQLTLNRSLELTETQVEDAKKYLTGLQAGKPIQYVLHEAWFFGMKLYVDERVLIPRPETEELITIIERDFKKMKRPERVLDLCTGSGCIALALKKIFPPAVVNAVDVSEDALAVALSNAIQNDLLIEFSQKDVLSDRLKFEKKFDLIVSNPPYVRSSEKAEMHSRVLQHEPHLALFVENNDPLIFYRKILHAAKTILNPDGLIYFEINESLGEELTGLSRENNFNSLLINDIFGKQRFLKVGRQNV